MAEEAGTNKPEMKEAEGAGKLSAVFRLSLSFVNEDSKAPLKSPPIAILKKELASTKT